jgi:hypothetical protein
MILRLVSREKLEPGGLFELIVPKDVCLAGRLRVDNHVK